MGKNNSVGNLLSDKDIISMCNRDNSFINVMICYEAIFEQRNKNLEMKLRILIPKELQYYKRKKTSWKFDIIPKNKNEILKIINEFTNSQKSQEVA